MGFIEFLIKKVSFMLARPEVMSESCKQKRNGNKCLTGPKINVVARLTRIFENKIQLGFGLGPDESRFDTRGWARGLVWTTVAISSMTLEVNTMTFVLWEASENIPEIHKCPSYLIHANRQVEAIYLLRARAFDNDLSLVWVLNGHPV